MKNNKLFQLLILLIFLIPNLMNAQQNSAEITGKYTVPNAPCRLSNAIRIGKFGETIPGLIHQRHWRCFY